MSSIIDSSGLHIPKGAIRVHRLDYTKRISPQGSIDDYAQKDRPLLERICPDEAPRVLAVRPFIIGDRDELKRHHFV